MTAASAAELRVVVIQGPVQALMACAAVRHAEALWQRDYRNVLLFGGILADDRSSHVRVVRAATLDCTRAVTWEAVLDFVDLADVASLRAALAPYGEVAEIICGRNHQLVNEVSLAACPQARRITVGDGFGVLDINPGPGWAQFHLAMPLLPMTLRPDALDGTELVITPREEVVAAIAALRAGTPGLTKADAALAEFASGGILMLMNYLTEAYGATVHGEIGLGLHLARSAIQSNDQPVVIKPHPRSSLGQTAAVARGLRADGHPVRIMGQYEFGQYPIEAFEALVHSVGTVQAQGSSSAFSLKYLYGIDAIVALPRRQARRALLPREFERITGGAQEAKRFTDSLPRWDGRSPMPFAIKLQTPVHAKVLGRLTRPITWNPIGRVKRHPQPWQEPAVPAALTRHLGTTTPARRVDREHGIVWLGRTPEDVAGGRPDPSASAAEAVRGSIAALSSRPGTMIAAVVAVTPATHAPGWQGWWRRWAGVQVVDNAGLSGEEFEDLLETCADVLVRVPEVGRTVIVQLREQFRGRPFPSGYAGFVFRVRAGAVELADGGRRSEIPAATRGR